MADVFGLETGIDVPGFASSNFGTWIIMIILILVMMTLAALVLWWYFNKRLYKFDIVVFENISGQGWRKSYTDKAKFLRLSKDGTEVFYLKKKKMPLTAYGRKMGINQYWFAIGQDGGWYNFVLGDLDAKQKILDIEPIDRDIKYVTVAMRRNAAENYGPKVTWMDKYGTWLMGAVTFIIFFGGIFFLLDQMGETAAEMGRAAAEIAKSNEAVVKALAHVDSILSGGSGIIPA